MTLLHEPRTKKARKSARTAGAARSRRKFLRFFPDGFTDETYLAWERDYKWNAHVEFEDVLGQSQLRSLIRADAFVEAANRAVRIESRTNLLFSFEKMALRDAVRSPAGAKAFVTGLYGLLYRAGDPRRRFEAWIEAVGQLPRRQTRVLTWPVLTVFPFLARPEEHIFLKPNVTRCAAEQYEFDFVYHSRPEWETYASLIAFAEQIRRELRDMRPRGPRDMIDIQSFIWVQGSEEYE
jgi:hypothetical protein